MSTNDLEALAEQVREQCISTAVAAYEDASISGLCAEGAFEAAISAIRILDVAAISAQWASAPPPEGQSNG